MSSPRSYGDPCGISRALDLVGERWALLVVRELLLGPRRFTDLRAGLGGASPNVLSQRLDELEIAGVVTRRTLAPPAASTVYELTPRGAALRPVVLALGAWGSLATPAPRGPLSASALMLALEVTFDAAAARAWRGRVAIVIGGDRFVVTVARRRMVITRGETACDATIAGQSETLRAAVFGRADARQLCAKGALTITGSAPVAHRFLSLFRAPGAT